jgi:hypothetical protein
VRVLIFFPFLYEDELLYSVFARYHQYSGNGNTKTTMDDLFGSTVVCAATILPSQLMELCGRFPIPNIYSPDDLINQHTLLPYYAPFIPDERYRQLKIGMAGNKGNSFYMKLGKTASTIKSPNYLRFCPNCIKEEQSRNGEVYWHRTHQVEGVKICPKHHVWLSESEVLYTERKNKHEFIALENSYHYCEERDGNISESMDFGHLKFISEQTYYLLNTKLSPLGLENLKGLYVAKLQEKKLATVTGRIKWMNLIPKFNNYYGKGLLKELNCYIEKDEQGAWLHKLFRKPRVSCHPLRHILVLGFLGETISSLVNQISNYSYGPFGAGPWMCLNKAADHYHRPNVTSCVVTRDYKTGQPVGTFSCSCGFVYSRRGPDKTHDDRYKIGRIKVFGPVWSLKLIELSKKNLSLREKARILGVDPITVKRQFDIKNSVMVEKEIGYKRDEYREKWLQLLTEYSEKSITRLRTMRPELFAWLYRNDKEWLICHQTKVKESRLNSHKRVDWEQRDKETADQIEKIAKAILSENGKPIRVSINEIGRRLGKVSFLYKNLMKLPRTRAALNKVVESVEKFQIRRIKHATSCLRRTNPIIYEWQIVRMAGLREKYAEKHKELIQHEVLDK